MEKYIKEDADIDFTYPVAIQDMIDGCEESQERQSFAMYESYARALDILIKNCCAGGSITEKQARILWYKYVSFIAED